jgi:epimerase transport system membrane fusion protein
MNAQEKLAPFDIPQGATPAGLGPAVERRERRLRLAGIACVLALFSGLGLWSVLAPLDSAALGPGVVVLENYRVAVDHLEGGIVRDVRAREGQVVKEGDVLLTLQDVQPRAQLEQVRGQWLVARAREARLVAQRDRASRVTFPAALLAHVQDPRAAEAMRVQEQTFRVRRLALEGEITLYERQVAQLREKAAGLR